MTDKKIKSILEELDRMVPSISKYDLIESRASHFLTSGINLLKQIEESFTPEEADELSRRILNSLRGKDPSKFQRKIRELKEGNGE